MGSPFFPQEEEEGDVIHFMLVPEDVEVKTEYVQIRKLTAEQVKAIEKFEEQIKKDVKALDDEE